MSEQSKFETQRPEPQGDEIFQQKKRLYFTKLGLETQEALKLHKKYGLWGKKGDKEEDWRNVSKHCLVETARVKTFAETFQLSEETGKKLQPAAALHDFDKKTK